MTDNPLKLVPKRQSRTPQEWVDRGNTVLACNEAMKDGSYMHRTDVRWVLRDGRCVIEWAR